MKTLIPSILKTVQAILLTCLVWLSLTGLAYSSHVVGGEITYTWISGNTYEVRLSLYRDCSGIPVATFYTINYESVTCGLSGSFAVNPTGAPEQVSPICGASIGLSSCNGGLLYGVEKYVYTGTVTLPGNCSDWVFHMNECCRNAAITNLDNGSGYGSYFSSQLNNLDVPFNNSVSFGSIPYSIVSNNATTQLSWNSYDSDGDSLIYELISARDWTGSNVFNLTYASGYTYQQPFISSLPTTLDYSNGMLTISPNQTQVCVVCMKISEYRNGFFIGEVNRDYQIVVENTSNTPPSLTGINGTSNFVISGCPGDSIEFTVDATDFSIPIQNVSLSMSNPGTSAVLTSVGGGPAVQGTFTWVPTLADVSASGYTFIITANDDNCDYYGTFSQAYQVFVNGCNTADVWPGDANADGDANLYDLLPIGIAYNDNGPTRPGASLNWSAQPCNDWATNFISGINHKHADTDGNGNVNFDDTTAIIQNYGMNHPLRLANPTFASTADLSVTANADTVGLSTTVNFDISFVSNVDSIYALAFRLYFDPAMIDVNSINVTYQGSVFGTNGVDMIKLDRSQGMNGFVDVALSKINQVNFSGSGQVVRVTIVTTDNVSGKVVMYVAPFDIEGITIDGSDVGFTTFGASVVIDPNFVGISENDPAALFQIYPVPAHDDVTFIYSGKENIKYIRLFDVAGKEVMQLLNPASSSTVNISGLDQGTYLVKTVAGENTFYKKIMIF